MLDTFDYAYDSVNVDSNRAFTYSTLDNGDC